MQDTCYLLNLWDLARAVGDRAEMRRAARQLRALGIEIRAVRRGR